MRVSVIHTEKGYVVRSGDNTTGINGEIHDRYRIRIKKLRDDIRAAVAGSDFVVSDIAEWSGHYQDYAGRAFVVKNGDREWLFLTSTSDDSTAYFGRNFGSYDSDIIDEYFRESDGSTFNRTDSNCLALHYNSKAGSYDMGFDDAGELTYTGGDFQAPASDPYSAAGDFMPVTVANKSDCFYGIVSYQRWNDDENEWRRNLFVFDDDSPSITWYATQSGYPICGKVMISGNCLVNTDVEDTNTEGVLTFKISFTSTTVGGHGGDEYIQAFNAAGERDSFNLTRATDYTYQNYADPEGVFKWKSVDVSNAGYDKGIIDTNLVRVAGSYNSMVNYGAVLAGPNGPFFKCSYVLCFPYASGIERFPWPE
jgi:hypothetical protein